MCVTLGGSCVSASNGHPPNAPILMRVKLGLAGSCVSASDVQPLNAPSPMSVTPAGSCVSASDVQPRNALRPMLVMLGGSSLSASVVQPRNSCGPIVARLPSASSLARCPAVNPHAILKYASGFIPPGLLGSDDQAGNHPLLRTALSQKNGCRHTSRNCWFVAQIPCSDLQSPSATASRMEVTV